jgi:hypothetical protein
VFDVAFVVCSIGSTVHGGGKKFDELDQFNTRRALIVGIKPVKESTPFRDVAPLTQF